MDPSLVHSLGGGCENYRSQETLDEFGEMKGGAPAPHDNELLKALSQLSSAVRQDSGPDGPSDICDDGCRVKAQASRIEFYRERTQVEVNQLR